MSTTFVANDRGVRLMLEAGDLFASTLDELEIFDHFAKLAVPALSDWCAVELTDKDGVRSLVAAAPSGTSFAGSGETCEFPIVIDGTPAGVVRAGIARSRDDHSENIILLGELTLRAAIYLRNARTFADAANASEMPPQ